MVARAWLSAAVALGCSSTGATPHRMDAGPRDMAPLMEVGPDGGGGGAGGAPVGPGTMVTVSAGLDRLVGAFPAPTGVIVVRQGHIELVTRQGAPLALLTSPREITAASFDGTDLVVADRAMLIAYDASLAKRGEALLAEPCREIDAVANRVVCAPNYGDAPAFWSYPLPLATARTRSTLELASVWPLGPLFRVPGRDQLLLADLATTEDWLVLYDVASSGTVSEIVTRGAYTQTRRRFVAFDGTPPTRVLADNGSFFRLGSADCATTAARDCLAPDGALSPRSTPELLLAGVGDGAGNIQILRTGASISPLCDEGCFFDSIAAATGQVAKSTTFRFSLTAVVSARYDSVSDAMVLGYRSTGTATAADGDRVALLDFSARPGPGGPGPDPGGGPAPIPPAPNSPLSGCVPNTRLVDGHTRVLTAAPVPGGALVVMYDRAVKMDRAGNVLASVARAVPPASAVFDAGTLAIGDDQGLALLDQNLRLLREIPVAGGCTTVALPGAGRVVCETPDIGDTEATVMNTFAIDSGARLASSPISPFAPKHGRRLRRVPGVDALAGETTGASTYALYAVASDGAVSFVNTSLTQPYVPRLPFAFSGSGRAGTAPVHLVAQSGSLLKIYDPDCLTSGAPFHAGCFAPDGEVGSQWRDQQLVAIADDGQGGLFTVTADDAGNAFPPSDRCPVDCLLVQHIDLASRRVLSSRMHSLPMGEALVMAPDAECGMLLAAYIFNGGDTAEPSSTEYRVDLIDYGAP